MPNFLQQRESRLGSLSRLQAKLKRTEKNKAPEANKAAQVLRDQIRNLEVLLRPPVDLVVNPHTATPAQYAAMAQSSVARNAKR